MSLLFAVRVFVDLCMYAGIAGSIGGVCGQTVVLWIPAAVCAVTVGAASLFRDKPVRFLALALLTPCFFLPENNADWVLLTPMVLYVLVLTAGARFSLDQGDYLDFFPRGLIALLVMLLVSLLGLDTAQLLRYGAAYVVGGVYLMRQLRLQKGSDWKDKLINLLALGAVLAAGALFSNVVRGVGMLIVWLWGQLKWLFAWVEQLLSGVVIPEVPAKNQQYDGDVRLPSPDAPEIMLELVPAGKDAQDVVKTVVIVLLIACAAASVIYLIWRMLGSFGKTAAASKAPVWTERAEGEKTERRKGLLSNRERLRRVYRRFLQLLKSRGAVVMQHHTTEDVHLQAIGFTEPEPARELRELYRPARYDEGAEVTGEQVRKAKELLRRLG